MYGALKLKIPAIGYKTVEQTVSFQMKMQVAGATKPSNNASQMSNMLSGLDKDLENIRLSADFTSLAGVTVTSTASGLKLDIDKKYSMLKKTL